MNQDMYILLIEPFFTGSHREWALSYQQHTRHTVELLTLPGRHWKWRMHGAAVSLARQAATMTRKPDLLLVSDMLDLTTFLALLPEQWKSIPVTLYFHENQITYPWSPTDQDVPLERNNQYGFINYTSALAADQVFFNSEYHRHSFLQALPDFLGQFPDFNENDLIEKIEAKSSVLYLGLDLEALQKQQTSSSNGPAIVLWNHRWEYDKNPEDFFSALMQLQEEGLEFELSVVGESNRETPSVFREAKEKLASRIRHWGYCESREDYARRLWEADVLPVTSRQDFFGASIAEAIFCRCFPILPHRLSYPEHIPEALQPACLYQTTDELMVKLRSAIVRAFEEENIDELSRFVTRYDWRTLAGQYDEQLSQVSKVHGL